jgi:hypothetical protein
MEWIWNASEFVRRVRCRMRFGELSRAPLKLLRLELREHEAECEWIIRPNDPWDCDLPMQLQEQHQAEQTLCDAIRLREFLFATLPQIDRVIVVAYREITGELDPIISGTLDRTDVVAPKIASLTMRAKLYGFRFCLEDGHLQPLLTGVGKLAFSS